MQSLMSPNTENQEQQINREHNNNRNSWYTIACQNDQKEKGPSKLKLKHLFSAHA